MEPRTDDRAVAEEEGEQQAPITVGLAQFRPCPFCGSTQLSLDCIFEFVLCDACGAYGPSGTTAADAQQRWNVRATDAPSARGASPA